MKNTSIETRCLQILQSGDFTADEIAAKTGDNILAMRPTVCNLFKEGYIRKTGDKRPNITGKAANVWSLKNVSISLVPDPDPEIMAFINQASKLGYSREEIKSLAEYPVDKVEYALNKFFS